MKKLVSITMMLVLAFSLVSGIAEDYSAMSNDELLQRLDLIFAELNARQYNNDNLLFEYEGLKVFFDRAYMKGFDKTLVVEVSVINEGDHRISIGCDDFFLNGWRINPIFAVDLRPGYKEKKEIKVYDVDQKAEINSISDLKEIDALFFTYDPETDKFITKELEGQKIIIQ